MKNQKNNQTIKLNQFKKNISIRLIYNLMVIFKKKLKKNQKIVLEIYIKLLEFYNFIINKNYSFLYLQNMQTFAHLLDIIF